MSPTISAPVPKLSRQKTAQRGIGREPRWGSHARDTRTVYTTYPTTARCEPERRTRGRDVPARMYSGAAG